MGSEAVRVAGVKTMLENVLGLNVLDRGNIVGPLRPWQEKVVDGVVNIEEAVVWSRAITHSAYGELCAGRVPIVLGGDSATSIGCISAVSRHCRESGTPLRVLWFSPTLDFSPADVGGVVKSFDARALACLCGHGPAGMTTLSGSSPALRRKEVCVIGVRTAEPPEREAVAAAELEIYDMRYVDEVGVRSVMADALESLTPATHLHVAINVGVADPSVAPGVGKAVPGGLSYREVQLAMEMVADTKCLRSVSLRGVNLTRDVRNKTAELAVELILSLFGASTLIRETHPPLRSLPVLPGASPAWPTAASVSSAAMPIPRRGTSPAVVGQCAQGHPTATVGGALRDATPPPSSSSLLLQ